MITTRGFGVDVMPQYTAPNPSLVAFNPSTISSGMMDAFNLARQYEDIKTKKALQAELAATREARIARDNALAGFDIAKVGVQQPLLQPRADLELAQMGSQQSLLGPETNLRMGQIGNLESLLPDELAARRAGLGFDTEKAKTMLPNLSLEAESRKKSLEAGLRTLEPVTDATIAQADAQAQEARDSVSLSTLKRAATAAQYETATLLSKLQEAGAPIEAQLKALKAGQALGNAKTEEEYRKALQALDVVFKQSQIFENFAQGQFALGLGRQSASGQQDTPDEEARKIQILMKATGDTPLPSGKTLSVYLSEAYEEDGVTPKKAFWSRRPLNVDPVGEQLKDVLANQRAKFMQLQGVTGKSLPQGSQKGPGKLEIKSIKRIQ